MTINQFQYRLHYLFEGEQSISCGNRKGGFTRAPKEVTCKSCMKKMQKRGWTGQVVGS